LNEKDSAMKITLAAAALVTTCLASPALGGDSWQDNHPRRAEVNQRLANQNARIKDGVKDGQLTHAQASQLHAEDHAIRTEERGMAAEHGGHLTKGEQRQLNRQENRVSRQIYAEKHP
jgi:hypothetical protein